VIVTPTNVPADSPLSYYETAKRIARETPNSFYLNQYHNPLNIEAHYKITGPEIWEQTEGKLDCCVAGIGTGGTLSGVGRFLKEKNKNIKIIAVDPVGSVFHHYFKTGKLPTPHVYKVEGIGEDMLTKAMDFSVVDEIYQATDKESFLMARRLTTEEGLFVGGSSGAAVAVAVKVAEKIGPGKRVVVILPDSGDRYLSKIYSDEWMKDNGFLEAEPRLGKVRDILHLRKQKVIVAHSGDRVAQVIAKMKKYDISQLPVVDNGKVLGMITEVDLLNYLVAGKHRVREAIKSIVERDVATLDPETSISTLSEIFSAGERNAVLVMEKGKLVGLVTKIDMIDYLAKKFKE
jgi:cystathionine beta-synthase